MTGQRGDSGARRVDGPGVDRVPGRLPPLEPVVRRVLAVVSVIVLVDVCFFAAIAPVLPVYVEQFDLTKGQAGVLLGSYALGTLVASLPAGWLASCWGARPTLLLGLVVLGGASLAFGFAPSFGTLVGARAVQGVGGACAWSAGLAWLIGTAPRERRGQAIGTVLGAGIAGAIGGPVIGGLAVAFSPAVVFSSVAVLSAGLAVAVVTTPVHGSRSSAGNVLQALRSRQVLAGAWLVGLPAAFVGVFDVLVPLRLDDLGATTALIAGVFLVAAAVEAVVSPVVGRLSDRRGRLLPVRAGLVGVVVGALLLPTPGLVWPLAGLTVVAAAAAGIMMTPASAMLSDGAEKAGVAQGMAFGVLNLAWAGGQALGSTGGGRLADTTNDAVPYVTVAVLAAATLLLLRLRPPADGRRPGLPG